MDGVLRGGGGFGRLDEYKMTFKEVHRLPHTRSYSGLFRSIEAQLIEQYGEVYCRVEVDWHGQCSWMIWEVEDEDGPGDIDG